MTLSADQPTVSVVTPVYNTEKYLSECIESVIRQSYPNWEYVIVDNRSKDSSFAIAERYAKIERRIRVVSNPKFLPVIENWNNALRHISSHSKYCKVVHADDWIFPQCLSEMVCVMEKSPNVSLVSAFRLEDTHVTLNGLPYPSTSVSGKEICRLTLLRRLYVFGSPTSVMMRSDAVRAQSQFYNEANLHADFEVCFKLLRDRDFGFIHQVLTYTRRHNEATTSFARRLNTFLPAELTCLIRYGPDYLSKEEYEQRLERTVNEYYRFLAGKLISRKSDDEFWQYHRAELGKLGLAIERAKLLGGCFSMLKEKLLNPIDTALQIAGFVDH